MADDKDLDQQIAEGGARLEAELAEEAAAREDDGESKGKGFPLTSPPGHDHWPVLGSFPYVKSGCSSRGSGKNKR